MIYYFLCSRESLNFAIYLFWLFSMDFRDDVSSLLPCSITNNAYFCKFIYSFKLLIWSSDILNWSNNSTFYSSRLTTFSLMSKYYETSMDSYFKLNLSLKFDLPLFFSFNSLTYISLSGVFSSDELSLAIIYIGLFAFILRV